MLGERTLYEAYGDLARRIDDTIISSARYPFQAEAIAKIAPDIASKLCLERHHRLLEIGFGSGVVLTPLANYVDEAIGIDQDAYVERLHSSASDNISLVKGTWPRSKPHGTFDRIVIYSVLHYLKDQGSAIAFVDAATEVLRIGGAILVGDLPNEDAWSRFACTPFGRQFEAEWRKKTLDCDDPEVEEMRNIFAHAENTKWHIDDRFILDLVRRYRARGLEAYVLPQDRDLPFGHVREDVLILRR
jgi:cyclopropane fatty-acyl-phospholipid synthase-like methyltransferase